MTKETIEEIGNAVFEQRNISPTHLSVSSKNINSWIRGKLVPFVPVQQAEDSSDQEMPAASNANKKNTSMPKWIRLNLAQAVWVSIVNELYNFKVPLDKLEELAYNVWQKPREQKFADKVFEHHIKDNPNNLPKHEIDKLKSHLRSEILMEHYFRTIINPFTEIVKSAFYRNELPHNFLYVPETNEFMFHYQPLNLTLDLTSIYLQKPMISIPIVPILSKILLQEYDNKKIKDLNYLSSIEKQIRDIVVFKRPKVVEIALQEGNIKTIVVTEEHKSRIQLAEYILKNKIKKGSKLLIDIRSNDHYKITLIKK
ncbi:hypothetical protein [Psychroserpens ponticola]|uniref:Uncharacterized protein n=1 Tax=Psychroserpens ponticola TaxID=2932268 RepID=A0ABY7RW60_9FLAO|nr:hypothetical protein [Psychroserpens ponticola]WCO01327.1 hypothetical protein MUN68_014815 [Psychroserpens ponticola]